METAIILNPYANRWKAGQSADQIRQLLGESTVPYCWLISARAGECEELAKQACEAGAKKIIAAGGDGTINEVINGILRAGNEILPAFGIIPVGTANDFAANIGLNVDLRSSIRRISQSNVARFDVCSVNGRYFINNAGLGLEPYISTIQHRMTRVSGILRYLLATFAGIAKNPQWNMTLKWDNGEYSGPVTMVSIGNGARTGGIFFTTPGANPQDGRMHFLFGSIPSRLGILKAFPRILRPAEGNISEHPAMRLEMASTVTVHCDSPSPSHADGEVFPSWQTDFEFHIHPSLISILID